MHIALNIKNESLSQKVLDFLASFKQEDIEVQTFTDEKEKSFSEFAGLWKDRDVDLKTIRETAWKR
ncbi:MAG: hypothetical protein U9P72_02055 [Campylobacterota bacterium]|nr:hypothetical protein [Campylobacterota bacterium]